LQSQREETVTKMIQEKMESGVQGAGCRVESRKEEGQFRGGLVFKAHKLCVSLNSRLASNTEEEEEEEEEGRSASLQRVFQAAVSSLLRRIHTPEPQKNPDPHFRTTTSALIQTAAPPHELQGYLAHKKQPPPLGPP